MKKERLIKLKEKLNTLESFKDFQYEDILDKKVLPLFFFEIPKEFAFAYNLETGLPEPAYCKISYINDDCNNYVDGKNYLAFLKIQKYNIITPFNYFINQYGYNINDEDKIKKLSSYDINDIEKTLNDIIIFFKTIKDC